MLINYRWTENRVRAADTTLRNCFHSQCQKAGSGVLSHACLEGTIWNSHALLINFL